MERYSVGSRGGFGEVFPKGVQVLLGVIPVALWEFAVVVGSVFLEGVVVVWLRVEYFLPMLIADVCHFVRVLCVFCCVGVFYSV